MKTNNYLNWLVPIEIAKKLKKIGFSELCLVENVETHSENYNFINFKEEMYSEAIVLLEDVELVSNKDLKDKLDIYKNFILRTAIPTFEQVLEWFISKGFIGTTVCFRDASLNKPVYIFEIKDEKGYLISSSKNITEKYKEAREALVTKLIEIYENNI